MEELRLSSQRAVIFLDGAVPSDAEHQVLLNILTDVGGIQDIVDRLEIQRLAWEREDRSKLESAQDFLIGTISNEDASSTEDVVRSNEEGVIYEPPTNPPPPPYRRD